MATVTAVEMFPVYAAQLKPGDRVEEYGDVVSDTGQSTRRPGMTIVQFVKAPAVFYIDDSEAFHVLRPLPGAEADEGTDDDDEADEGTDDDEAAPRPDDWEW